MNQQSSPAPREHYFYVAIAKFLFYHPKHGVISVGDPIKLKDAEKYALSPLILYALSVAGVPIRWMTYTPADKPRAFQNVLTEAWRDAKGLRGKPNILWINRHLAKASPDLKQKLGKMDVEVKIVDAKNKSPSASLRSAQDSSKWLLDTHSSTDKSLSESIKALCMDAQRDHDYSVMDGNRGTRSGKEKEMVQQWMSLSVQKPIASAPCELDWELGPWLSSWESSVPPDMPRYFYHGGFNLRPCLLIGKNVLEETAEDIFWDDQYYGVAEIAKNLIACWPNPPLEIAKSIGTTLKKLQWFISKEASLDPQIRGALEDLLGIVYDEHTGNYSEEGPYVLMAQKPLALKNAYESISEGGCASPCEIIPCHGVADPSWRYILLNTYGKPPSIVMSPRGATITDRLPDLLMNYEGIIPVSREFYNDVVFTCAQACRSPETNVREMRDFAKRYETSWKDSFWHPQ
ncbi:hypothetical protein BerOc1_00974 [Pseudodesulfovibrio hydrargyri]|uniref:Uncharacterized protein n=1 Tax=Pseudodesulfovibrio hydrargyri TaxID=2125990 RepID=A0A1J5N6Y3_9BACT|nr:hypothetical protein [Pseudodesulfovibrio hydrargyri]OIQ49055.1 hypothetical protein BerOc1_00974 [Pseudodesulfovibrio hydrargyri]